ncbi:HNH endonuclease signature motif containing protein [Streptomyces sparsogenes]|uniref:HNH endonuclease signature motif containing protein n=1 Tax=Streptomyces sparsogenes TaxID=67365 RepID=UPI0033D17FEC
MWTGSRLPRGYGRTSVRSSWIYLHRLMYMAFVGEIADGMHIDHLCRKPPCCNPKHLEQVTCYENVHRSPIASAAVNAKKTHCKRGHPLSGENLLINEGGGRVCRTCVRLRGRQNYYKRSGRDFDIDDPQSMAPAPPSATRDRNACPQGHPFDEANTYTDPSGNRRCRTCARERHRVWREKQKKSTS